MSDEPFDVLAQATEAMDAGLDLHAIAACAVIAAAELARIRHELLAVRRNLHEAAHSLHVIALNLDDPQAGRP